ncbi:MAG: acyl-CoA dehydrogenase [Chitinophagales bacterium]
MSLVINEEQQMLKNSAKEFLKNRAPVSALRLLRDNNDSKGYDIGLWQEMAEMGWASLTIPETYGGLDFGHVGLGQIMEEMGRTLTASPLFSTIWLGTTAIKLAGNVLQKESLLPVIAEGNMVVAFALEEGNRHHSSRITTTAIETRDGYILTGKKVFVLDGHVANKLIVVARTADGLEGIHLFLVDANAEGLSVERKWMMDSRNAATVTFHNVPAEMLGEDGDGFGALEKTLDIARIGLAAEMLGTMQEAFDRTIAYLKERTQFGVQIGSFQALQHRAALMYSEIELCKSLVIQSLQAIDDDSSDLEKLASMTKAKVGEVIELVTNEAIQMHGGIGVTDDEEIGFFMKRARVAQRTLGDYNYHLDRFARLNGF